VIFASLSNITIGGLIVLAVIVLAALATLKAAVNIVQQGQVGVLKRLGQYRRNARRDALARIDGRGRCLVHVDAPVGQREDNVREGAANIHADTRNAAHVRTPMVRIFASTMAPINLLTSEMDVSQD